MSPHEKAILAEERAWGEAALREVRMMSGIPVEGLTPDLATQREICERESEGQPSLEDCADEAASLEARSDEIFARNDNTLVFPLRRVVPLLDAGPACERLEEIAGMLDTMATEGHPRHRTRLQGHALFLRHMKRQLPTILEAVNR